MGRFSFLTFVSEHASRQQCHTLQYGMNAAAAAAAVSFRAGVPKKALRRTGNRGCYSKQLLITVS